MPATSKAQQKAAGAALSAKRGDTSKSDFKGASREMYDSMSEKQLEEFAATKLIAAKPISTAPSSASTCGMRRVAVSPPVEARMASAFCGLTQPRSIQVSRSRLRRWR